MPTPDPQSVVHVQTYANGKAAITITGKGGTLTLEVFADDPMTDPTIAITDLERGQHPLRALVGVKANGNLRGFFVEKNDDGSGKGTLVWFPARKKRRTKKHATKKRTTKT